MDTRAPRLALAKKIILAICLVIVCAWIIVTITVSTSYDYNIWNGTFSSFNAFTALAAICGAMSYGIYRTMPSARSKVESIINTIPRKWRRLVDSGSTPYFNPDYYTIVNGVYRKQVNPNIAVDSFGLPIVDHNVPLTSFDIDIYRQYYRFGDNDMNHLTRDLKKECSTDPSITSRYKWEGLIDMFYTAMRDQLRINTMGETCWIVEPWHRKPLLIHKSNYISFIKDDISGSGWETSVVQSASNSRYEIGKITGLRWLLETVTNPTSGDDIQAPNRHLYVSIYKELWAITNMQIGTSAEANAIALETLYRFCMDQSNPLGYPSLNRIFMEVMIQSAVIKKLPDMISRAIEIIKTESAISASDFYKQLTDSSAKVPAITFKSVLPSIEVDINLIRVLEILHALEQPHSPMVVAFAKNMERPSRSIVGEGSFVECIRIVKLAPYIKNYFPDVWKIVRSHNNNIMSKANRRTCAAYISKNLLTRSSFADTVPIEFYEEDASLQSRNQVLAMGNTEIEVIPDRVDKSRTDMAALVSIMDNIQSTETYTSNPNISEADQEIAKQRIVEMRSRKDKLSTKMKLRTHYTTMMTKLSKAYARANQLMTQMRLLPLDSPRRRVIQNELQKIDTESQRHQNDILSAGADVDAIDVPHADIQLTDVALGAVNHVDIQSVSTAITAIDSPSSTDNSDGVELVRQAARDAISTYDKLKVDVSILPALMQGLQIGSPSIFQVGQNTQSEDKTLKFGFSPASPPINHNSSIMSTANQLIGQFNQIGIDLRVIQDKLDSAGDRAGVIDIRHDLNAKTKALEQIGQQLKSTILEMKLGAALPRSDTFSIHGDLVAISSAQAEDIQNNQTAMAATVVQSSDIQSQIVDTDAQLNVVALNHQIAVTSLQELNKQLESAVDRKKSIVSNADQQLGKLHEAMGGMSDRARQIRMRAIKRKALAIGISRAYARTRSETKSLMSSIAEMQTNKAVVEDQKRALLEQNLILQQQIMQDNSTLIDVQAQLHEKETLLTSQQQTLETASLEGAEEIAEDRARDMQLVVATHKTERDALEQQLKEMTISMKSLTDYQKSSFATIGRLETEQTTIREQLNAKTLELDRLRPQSEAEIREIRKTYESAFQQLQISAGLGDMGHIQMHYDPATVPPMISTAASQLAAAFQDRVAQKVSQVKRLEHDKQSLQRMTDTYTSEITGLNAKIQSMAKTHEDTNNLVIEANRRLLEQSDRHSSAIKAMADEYDSRVAQMKSDLDTRIKTDVRTETVVTELQELRALYESTKGQLDARTRELDLVSSRLTSVDVISSTTDDQIRKSSEELRVQNGKVAMLEAELINEKQSMQKMMRNEKERRESMERDVAARNAAKYKPLEEKLVNQINLVEEQDNTIMQLTTRIQAAEFDVQRFSQKGEELEEFASKLKEDMSKKQRRIKKLKDQIADMELKHAELTERTNTYDHCIRMIGHPELGDRIPITGLIGGDREVNFTLDGGMIRIMISVLQIIDDSVAFVASKTIETSKANSNRRDTTDAHSRAPLSARGSPDRKIGSASNDSVDVSPATKISKLNIERTHAALAKILSNAYPPVHDDSQPKISRTFAGKLVLLMYSIFNFIAQSNKFQSLFARMRVCAQSDDPAAVNRVFANSRVMAMYHLMQKVFIYYDTFDQAEFMYMDADAVESVPIYSFVCLEYPDLFSAENIKRSNRDQYPQEKLSIIFKYMKQSRLEPM
jgi:hypothetical protein